AGREVRALEARIALGVDRQVAAGLDAADHCGARAAAAVAAVVVDADADILLDQVHAHRGARAGVLRARAAGVLRRLVVERARVERHVLARGNLRALERGFVGGGAGHAAAHLDGRDHRGAAGRLLGRVVVLVARADARARVHALLSRLARAR